MISQEEIAELRALHTETVSHEESTWCDLGKLPCPTIRALDALEAAMTETEWGGCRCVCHGPVKAAGTAASAISEA